VAGFSQFVAESKDAEQVNASDLKPVVISPGRFNPPHLGHKSMINELKKLAERKGAEPVVVIVDSGKRNEKNPLDGEVRKKYLQQMQPGVRMCIAKNPYDAVEQLKESGYVPVGGCCGSDRAGSYKSMVGRIYGKDVEDGYEAVVLFRDSDSSDVAGVSATKVREAAADDNVTKVRAMTGLNDEDAREMIALMKEHLN
jgi:cytidyltransferase-like protein